MIEVGSDFSGAGAFDQALIRLGIDYKTVFACDMDKYARITYAANYLTEFDVVMEKIALLGDLSNGDWAGDFYFPRNVYSRKIPTKPLDIYMTSPPCQAFSLAGKRKGEDDDRGVLFYNSHEFITKNKPRYFIFENVKGLLSDAKGRTFQIWLDMLGGKSVNGNPVIFPREDATPYHIYYKVLNAKHYGVPQNRERVFIIGIRDDADNTFTWPKPQPLTKRLKDVLEAEVDDKYYLSDEMLKYLFKNSQEQKEKGNGFKFSLSNKEKTAKAITTKEGQRMDDNFIQDEKILVSKEVRTEESKEIRKLTGTNDFRGKKIEFRPQSVANTITTSLTNDHFLKQENWIKGGLQQNQPKQKNGVSPCLTSAMGVGGGHTPIHNYDYKIRKLTPRECFRLMDFPDSFKFVVSNTQLYKQAGNSIVVNVLAEIIKVKTEGLLTNNQPIYV